MDKMGILFYLMVGIDADTNDRVPLAYGPYQSYEICMEKFRDYWDKYHDKMYFLMACQPESNLTGRDFINMGRL